ncbi:MAG: class I SAM-dependent methyltransferase [Actinomycetota bacterium]|nr:class I SAM-dependent methyltransferase [Actinomycetota bacterium]
MSEYRSGDGPGCSMWHTEHMPLLYDSFHFDADIPFYLRLLRGRTRRASVLELGCGTGRVTTALDGAGFDVVGVDSSTSMLERAAAKLSAHRRPGGIGTELVHGDMTTLELDRTFDFVLVPVKTFFYLVTAEAQHSAVERMRRHLAPGGTLVLDLLHPTLDWMARQPGSVVQDVAGVLDGATVLRTETTVATDLALQLRTTRSVYELVATDGSVRKDVLEWELRYAHRYEMEHLLARHGLEVTSVAGDYDGTELRADSPVMLVVGRPSE